jgi:hypothetical protein
MAVLALPLAWGHLHSSSNPYPDAISRCPLLPVTFPDPAEFLALRVFRIHLLTLIVFWRCAVLTYLAGLF